ncbi:hypothetical protein EAE96_003745 [Botrytis aclada]|nr:hypothetical protein EAE96_003745 [Botrytis aclada]
MKPDDPFGDLTISPFAKNWCTFYVKFRSDPYPTKYDVEKKRVSTKNTFFHDLGLHRTPEEPYPLDDCFRFPLLLILQWLQEDHMEVLLCQAKIRHKPAFNETWAIVVVRLCVLCEYWDFPVAFNAAMDHLIYLRDFSFMAPKQIEAIYKTTDAGSCLRRLIGDMLSIKNDQEQSLDFGSLKNSIDGEVFEELLNGMRTRELPNPPLFDPAGNIRFAQLVEYHMKL